MDLDRLGYTWVTFDGSISSVLWVLTVHGSPRLAEGTTMNIDYVRIYQKEGEESVTCDPRKSLRSAEEID